MTTAEAVRTAASPQLALMALAEGVDQILALAGHVQQEWTDPWPQPLGQLHTVDDNMQTLARAAYPEGEYHVEGLREKLLTTTDGEERRALEAAIRLAEDTGRPIEPAMDEGVRLDLDGELVGFPAASMQLKAARAVWLDDKPVHSLLAQGNALTELELRDAYVRGGPMWLYLYDREAIMAMPPPWRMDMVQDVEIDSPAQAQELARDILKDLSSDGGRDSFGDNVGAA